MFLNGEAIRIVLEAWLIRPFEREQLRPLGTLRWPRQTTKLPRRARHSIGRFPAMCSRFLCTRRTRVPSSLHCCRRR